MKKLLGELTFKLSGWTYEVDSSVLEKKQVIIGFEHTSMMDAVLSLAIFQIHNIKIHTLIKKELFKGPFKPILEKIGGIPVDLIKILFRKWLSFFRNMMSLIW